MSRDPEDGYIDKPTSLHKYLYSNGDPVNLIDPSGRGEGDYVEITAEVEEDIEVYADKFECVDDAYRTWRIWNIDLAITPKATAQAAERVYRDC